MTIYARHGDELFVQEDIDGSWHTFYRQATGARGRYRLKSPLLLDRATREEAEADLAAYAEKNGYPEV